MLKFYQQRPVFALNKIESTPILKLAMVKRKKIVKKIVDYRGIQKSSVYEIIRTLSYMTALFVQERVLS